MMVFSTFKGTLVCMDYFEIYVGLITIPKATIEHMKEIQLGVYALKYRSTFLAYC